jgi:hypothetical protein
MIVAALLFATAAPHCADPGFCPTIDELRLAVLLDEQEDTGILIDDPRPVRQVSEVYCEKPDYEQKSVTCKATFHYRTGRSFQIVRLTKSDGEWQVEQRMELFQKR